LLLINLLKDVRYKSLLRGEKHRLPVVNVGQGESVTEERRSVCVGKEIHATGLNIKRAESIAKKKVLRSQCSTASPTGSDPPQ